MTGGINKTLSCPQAEDRVNFELTKSQLMGIRHVKKSMRDKPMSATTDDRRGTPNEFYIFYLFVFFLRIKYQDNLKHLI